MTQAEVIAILTEHHPLKRADIYQIVVSRLEIKKKPIPTLEEFLATLQRMIDTNRIYIHNAPNERDLTQFPYNIRPAYLELSLRRKR